MPPMTLAGLALALGLAFAPTPLPDADVDAPVRAIPVHDMYKDWKQPGNGASCCNETDCAPTQARWLPDRGQWEAKYGEKWVLIPNNRILPFEAPDGNAHLCAQGSYGWGYENPSGDDVTVLCFTPPAARI